MSAAILFGVVLVRMGYDQEEIGTFEWFLFLTNVVSFFWSMGMMNGLKSYFPSLDESTQRKLLFGVGVVLVLFSILGCAALLTYGWWSLLMEWEVLLLLGSYLLLAIPSGLSEHILILEEKAHQIAWYGVLSYGTYFFGLSATAYIFRDVVHLYYFLVLWGGVRFLYAFILICRSALLIWDFRLVASFVLFCLPLIGHVLLGSGMEYVDGFLVEHYFSREDFAVFRYGARELPLNTVLISAIISTLLPVAVVQLTTSLAEVRMRLTRLMHWLFPVSALLILISEPLFQWMYGPAFHSSAIIFSIYLLILCSRLLLPQLILYAKHENVTMLSVAFIELIINISLSVYLMRGYGLYGIAAATVVAYLIQKVLLTAIVWVRHGISISSYIHLGWYLVYSVVLYAVFALVHIW